ncbi:MAG TPA: elongation factor P [Ignavibacteria bacterium]|mgnify:CR=1 FL=1|nr:elongation factor P [Ignavibacteria bacterium]HQY53271.1 elongation factor P [Ignavibacteria bacterium]HRB01095.1 elongation factor P [Ignavibacteria bacterium]
MASTSDLKNGVIINFNNELHSVISVEHRTPGNLRAFYQVKLKNLKNGKTMENRFRSGESIQLERLDTGNYQYLYKDGEDYVFMENETFEQVTIAGDIIGKGGNYLKEGEIVQIMFHNSNPLSIEIPPHVFLKVISAPPGVKGDTATGATKPVELETGATVNAPLFINEGDVLKVDSRTGDYIERAKL